MTDFTDQEVVAIRAVTFTACFLSIFGCFFVMFSYWIFPNLRSFPMKLVLIQSVTDLFGSFSTLMSIFSSGSSFDGDSQAERLACIFQGAGIQFFYMSAFIWTFFIALTALIMIKYPLIRVDVYEKYFHLVAWGLPGIFLIILLSLDSFGESGVWCWIEDPESPFRFGFFYGPMIAILIANLILYVVSRRELRIHQDLMKEYRNVDAQSLNMFEEKIFKRLLNVVLSWIFCWMWAVINRLHNTIDPDNPQFWLYFIHSCFSPTFGFFNSLIYGNSKALRRSYQALFSGKRASIRFGYSSSSSGTQTSAV